MRAQINVNVLRIEAIATMSGISTAGSVPKTNSRITSAPAPPIMASVITLGPEPLDASFSASRPVSSTVPPLKFSFKVCRTSPVCEFALKPCWPVA